MNILGTRISLRPWTPGGGGRLGRTAVVGALALVLLAIPAPTADSYHTNFTSLYCNTTKHWNNSPISRSMSRVYASGGAKEGYQWGGGCWNTNNVDDSPNDPQEDPNTRGEGGDCSGFVFKSWYLKLTTGQSGFHFWSYYVNVHGNYSAASFKNASSTSPVFRPLDKRYATVADAYASSNHIAMVYQPNTSYGTDQIIEAASEAAGTRIRSATLRGNTGFRGVRRQGWSG